MGVESQSDPVSQPITLRLHRVRGEQVILDGDLARLYGIPTKQLNQNVKRHSERFPPDFAFQLTLDEWRYVRDGAPKRRGRGGLGHPPYAFTEQGVLMLVGIMCGRRATAISIEILRAFAARRDGELESVWDWGNGLFTDLERIELVEKALFGDEPGTVTYFIQSGTNGPIKIGVTTNFSSRFRSLEMSSPTPLRVLGVVPTDIEDECHVALHEWRLHGEWFKPDAEVLTFIRRRLPMRRSVN